MARTTKFAPVRVAIKKGLEKVCKLYKTINGNDAYFICLALDPAIKLKYAKNNWDSKAYHAGYAAFKKVFAEYYEATTDATPALTAELPDSPVQGYGSSWIRDHVRPHVERETSLLDPFQEFLDYINSPLVKKIKDPVHWWGEHQSDYPTLSRIAHDYLAIQGSSVLSEGSFSSRSLTDAFEALQILKRAYKNGLISASKEAAEGVPQEWTPNV
ncbi:hypothetical protein K443DRAFT_132922 [Laccaria amethystina LaAM-08-1]|uniref:HAT C-terminal dimerisation domain-containing protein n=1 Tax=Laccaria amethystina LaAM-08-1 TaxID=1095629 RepID=A0A0C9XV14_9AGAR|nr:hypothetical protein K443DRAFT_132922 [Laccaria amethystina LaAM-08-1]